MDRRVAWPELCQIWGNVTSSLVVWRLIIYIKTNFVKKKNKMHAQYTTS